MRYVAAAFVFYFALVSFYINIGEDMTPANYLPWLLPVIGALVLFQYGARKRLFSLNHAPHLFAGVLWCVTFPLLYSWSYATPWYVSLIRLDFLCGTGIFLLLASWQSLVFSYGKLSRPVAALFAALDFACLAIPFVQIVYFSIYGGQAGGALPARLCPRRLHPVLRLAGDVDRVELEGGFRLRRRDAGVQRLL